MGKLLVPDPAFSALWFSVVVFHGAEREGPDQTMEKTMRDNSGYVDSKIVLARKLLREGASLSEMAGPLGYKSGSSVRSYLKRYGLPTPENHGGRHKVSFFTAARKKAVSDRMKAWHAERNHQAEKGNRPL